MKYCPNCGAQCPVDAPFCSNCGAPLQNGPQQNAGGYQNGTWNNNTNQGNAGYNQNMGYNPNQNAGYNQNNWNGAPNQNNMGYNYPNPGITPRSIPVCVILSIVTCGIYGIYWLIKLNDEINILANDPGATSGGIVFLLSIVTCGIYLFYWLYKMGEKCDRIKGTSSSSGILYLILGIVGFSIISYCLMQDTINKAV